MAYSVRRAQSNRETRAAERMGKLLTEDMMLDLDRMGYYMVRNLPRIVYHRLEAVFLSAKDESDILMGEYEKERGKGLGYGLRR